LHFHSTTTDNTLDALDMRALAVAGGWKCKYKSDGRKWNNASLFIAKKCEEVA
jgi:hypothetical protein